MRNRRTIGIVIIGCFVFSSLLISAQQLNNNVALVIIALNNSGNAEKAVTLIDNLNEQQKLNVDVLMAMAANKYKLGKYKDAATLYTEINKTDKKLANYELAQCYARLNKPNYAVKYLRIYLELKPQKMQREIKSDKAFYAIDHAKEWIDLWQTQWFNKYDLLLEDAWFDYESGAFESVLAQTDYLNKVRKSLVDAYYLKALAYMKLGEPVNALISINNAIEKRDKIARYYSVKARAELELNKSKKALKSIQKALTIDSTQVEFYFIRASAYLQSKNIDAALFDLKALMNLVPDFETYLLAAKIFENAGELQEALKAYNKCVALQKYNPQVYILRASLYMKMYGYEFAEKDYSMALDFMPYEGELYYKRGIARKKQHKAKLACQDFHKAYKFQFIKADEELRSYCQGR